jgi:uncharacterized protein (DUF4415 family)
MKHVSTGKTPLANNAGATDWARVRTLPDAGIHFDADSPRTTVEDWAGATIKRAGTVVGTVKRRGANKQPLKVSTTLRLPAEVLAAWKATGKGWQTRMAAYLAVGVVG